MYCWHILANKHHDMPDTNYDKFNLVVSTLFLNKWYLKKSTFFENDPYKYNIVKIFQSWRGKNARHCLEIESNF